MHIACLRFICGTAAVCRSFCVRYGQPFFASHQLHYQSETGVTAILEENTSGSAHYISQTMVTTGMMDVEDSYGKESLDPNARHACIRVVTDTIERTGSYRLWIWYVA